MITCLITELHKSGYVGFKFWQVDRVAGTARIFLAYVSPHLPKRGRVRLHVSYPIHGEDSVLWLEEIKARAGATTQLGRYTPRSHTATVTHRGFIFRFHFPRAKAMWSKFSNQRMETSLRPSSVRVHMDGGWWAKRESQLRIHSFIRKEYTPFWRERHVRIPDHLCVWLKLKKEPEFPRNKKRIQSSGSDAREEEVRAWKHDVSFNRLATDYCI